MKPNRFVLAAVVAFFAVAVSTDADAARRWFAQTPLATDGKLVSFTDDTNAEAPDGTVEVDDATIRAADPPGATGDILPLGTWDGTTYTAPSGGGIVVHIDPSTDIGAVQEA